MVRARVRVRMIVKSNVNSDKRVSTVVTALLARDLEVLNVDGVLVALKGPA